jgi:hypothetical protein
MKNIKSLTLLLLLVLFGTMLNSSAQSSGGVPDGLAAAIKAGNSRELSRFFNTNIELVLPNTEDVYSKTQAELIIKDFFQKNQPANFIILHQGGKETSRYAIGTLTTEKGVFRVYFLLRIRDGEALIHQLRIEKEDD